MGKMRLLTLHHPAVELLIEAADRYKVLYRLKKQWTGL